MSSLGWLAQPAVLPWFALGFGLCIGSFLNVVIHRLPKMMEREWRAECADLAGQPAPQEPPLSLVSPRSRCPSCGHAITAIENIPLVSWAVLRADVCRAARALRSSGVQSGDRVCGIVAHFVTEADLPMVDPTPAASEEQAFATARSEDAQAPSSV